MSDRRQSVFSAAESVRNDREIFEWIVHPGCSRQTLVVPSGIATSPAEFASDDCFGNPICETSNDSDFPLKRVTS
ncbi:MAG: hypothetical protein CMM00_11770 [Rhodopirellula sp.]|nr:hypothetical protein [Rhodopirellula sp.]